MLTITPVRNVQNTINNLNNRNKVSFKSGVQSNLGADVINTANENNDNSLMGFLGSTIKYSPLFFNTFMQRQQSIEKGLEKEQNKINAIA